MNLLYISFPGWLKPEIIPGIPVRWYGLMYIFAFATAYLLFRRQIKERNFPMSEDDMSGLFFWGILGLLLGARLFSALVYHGDNTYWLKPWLIFWPFQDGKFTGFQGMSYHGGVIGCVLGIILYTRVKKFNFREICDMVVTGIPLGYTFGRLGNFINAELYGRVTESPLGMIFPGAAMLPISENWVAEIAEKCGIETAGAAFINLPRHPSQLYEAFFEGIVLFAIMWCFRSRKPFKGFQIGLYLFGYGFFRFIIEYFREPDSHLGYPIELVKTGLHPAYSHHLLNFSTGQIFCFLMMVSAVVWLIIVSRLADKEVFYIYSEEQNKPQVKTETSADRNKRRKLRKKLR